MSDSNPPKPKSAAVEQNPAFLKHNSLANGAQSLEYLTQALDIVPKHTEAIVCYFAVQRMLNTDLQDGMM